MGVFQRSLLAGVSILALSAGVTTAAWAQADVDATVTVGSSNTPFTSSGTVTGPTSTSGSNGNPAGGNSANTSAGINVTTNNATVNATGGTVTGGTGGNGGNASTGAFDGGDGGDSAGIYVKLGVTNASISVSQGATVSGGTGGNGGSAGGAGGTGGAAGGSFAVDIRGSNATLNNYGIIHGGTPGSVGAANGGTAPSGKLMSGGVGIGSRGQGSGNIVNNDATGQILGNGGFGVAVGPGGGTINNSGAISTTNGNHAIYVTGSTGLTTINNNAGGTITGGSGQQTPTQEGSGRGIQVDTDVTGDVSITNRGTITGGNGGANYIAGTAIDVGSSGAISVNNYGTLTAGTAGTLDFPRIAITFDLAGAAATFNNYSGTLNGGIGTSTHGDQINFYGGTLNGSIYGQATSAGTMNGTGADVYFRSGTTTVNGDIGKPFGTSATVQGDTAYWGPVLNVTVADGGTIKFGSDSNVYMGNLSFSNSGSYDFGTHKITFHDYFDQIVSVDTQVTTGTMYYRTTIDTLTGKHGYMVYTPGISMVDHTMLNFSSQIVPTVVGNVTSGSKYIIIQDTNGRQVINLPSVVNSGGYTWTVGSVTGSGQTDTDGISYGNGYTDVVITAGNHNASGLASGTNGNSVSTLASYSGSDSTLQSLSQAVNNLTSSSDIQKAGAQLRPETTAATTQAAMGVTSQALGTVQTRSDSVRAAAADQTGVASGETPLGMGVWGQGFGAYADQGKREGVDGYTAGTYGLAFGADTKVLDDLRGGLSLAYAHTKVNDSGSREGSGQTIGSYIATLYGTYTQPKWYVDGSLTYGWHDFDSTRLVNFNGATEQTAKGSYAGQQYGARTEFGYPLALGSATVTPLASLEYNHFHQNSYTETGASGASLSVGSTDSNSIRGGLGGKISQTIAKIDDWDIKPNARAVWLHEFNGTAPDQTSSFVAGGSSFTTPGTKVAREHLGLGLGLDMASVRDTTISLKYDADLSDRYVSHSGFLQVRTEF